MWPKSACDFLAPLLLSRNRRFAECILIPRKPNPCSIEFGGEHHHAGDVHRDDEDILGVTRDVVGGLVDDVHQDGGQVSHHEYAQWLLSQ